MNEGLDLTYPKDGAHCSGWSKLWTVTSGKVLLHPLYRWGTWGLESSPDLADLTMNERQQRKWFGSLWPKVVVSVGEGRVRMAPARLIGAFPDHKALRTLLMPAEWGTVHHGLSGLAYLLAHPPPVGFLQEAGSVYSPGILRSHKQWLQARQRWGHQVGVGGDLQLKPAPELTPDPAPEGEREWEQCTTAQLPRWDTVAGRRGGTEMEPRSLSSVQFSHSVVSDSSRPHGQQHTRLPCPSPTPRACWNSCLLSRWCHPTISSSVISFSSHLQSFPASGSFLMSQLFTSGSQSIGVLALTSVLPMNIQDWFPLGWTGWSSLQSKGLSRVFSNTTIQKHQFFSTQLSL